MGSHQSSVNFKNLIRDLADMYTGNVGEVVLIELLANALDAKPSRIDVTFDPANKVLTVVDNGCGMTESGFAQYHDIAAGLKTKGTAIGFAGVGAKIAFNVARRVVTETRSARFCGGSDWYLKSDHELVWDDIRPTRLEGTGTLVEVHFDSRFSPPYVHGADIERAIWEHFAPLLDPTFLQLYATLGLYDCALRFTVNGSLLDPQSSESRLGLTGVRRFFPLDKGQRIGYGVLGLAASEYPCGMDCLGVLVCTHGKVIKGEMFNQFPSNIATRVFGIVEIPNLVKFLTTAKTDFVRRRHFREFESLYGPVREEFVAWLEELGVRPVDRSASQDVQLLERDLKRMLDDVPEFSEFFGFRARKAVPQRSPDGQDAESVQGVDVTFPDGSGERGEGPGLQDVGNEPGETLVQTEAQSETKVKPISRTARRGPKIAFSEAEDRVDLAWVEGNTIVVNSGHPAYRRVKGDNMARRVLCLLAIGTAVWRFVGKEEGRREENLPDRIMASWGKLK